MAITSATTRADFSGFLNPETSAPIFDEAARQSAQDVEFAGRQSLQRRGGE